ncbi:MAG: sigma-70 family RNA polymerase sigma factor [Polyangia bacterium]
MDKPQPVGLSEAEEAVLVTALQARQAGAFERLIRAYGGRLLAVARRIVRDEQEAQDVVQETFLSALQAIDRFEGRSRLYTWLHRIAVHAALYKLRARKSRSELAIDDLGDLLPRFLPDGHQVRDTVDWRGLPDHAPDHAIERRELHALVRSCVDRLPDTYRTVLILRDLEELCTEATAEILQINEGAVKVRLHRARQALRALLEPHLAQKTA